MCIQLNFDKLSDTPYGSGVVWCIYNVYTADFWQIVVHAQWLRRGVVYIQCVYRWLWTNVKTQLYRHCMTFDKCFTRPVAQAWCGVNTCVYSWLLTNVKVSCNIHCMTFDKLSDTPYGSGVVWCIYAVYTADFWQMSNLSCIHIILISDKRFTRPVAQTWCGVYTMCIQLTLDKCQNSAV